MTPEHVREALADVAHDHWATHVRHLLGNGTRNPDGSVTLPAGYVHSLHRQMLAKYRDMPDEERRYDRTEADAIWQRISEVVHR